MTFKNHDVCPLNRQCPGAPTRSHKAYVLWFATLWAVYGLSVSLSWGQEKPQIQLPEVVIVGQEERVLQDEKSLIQLHAVPIGLRGDVETGKIAQLAPPATADFAGPTAENPGCLLIPRIQSEQGEGLYRRGIARFNDKRYPAALDLFERLQREYPASPYVSAAAFWSGEAAYQQGHNEIALTWYERVISGYQKEPLRDYALLRAAQIRLELADYNRASAYLADLLTMYPASSTTEQALYLAGEAAFRAGQFQTAIRSLQTFLQRFPQSSLRERAELWYAESLYRLKRYPQARDAYQHMLQRFAHGPFALEARYGLGWSMLKAGEAQPAYLLFEELNRQFPAARSDQAVRYASFIRDLQAGKLDDALHHWEQLQQRYPDGILTVAALNELAWTHFVRQDYARALDFYRQVVRAAAASERLQDIAQYMIGESLYQQGKFADAAPAFRQVRSTAEAGLLEKAAFRLGLALYHLQDDVQAIQVLQAFMVRYAASPYRDEVLFWLAESYFRQGNYHAALEVYQRIPAASRLYDYALHGTGWVYIRMQDWPRAIDVFGQLIAAFPNSPLHGEALYRRAECYQYLKQQVKAQQGYEQYLEVYPRGALAPAARLQLALLAMRADRFATAITALQQLRLQFVGTEQATEAQYWLGMTFFQQQRFDAARETFQNLVNTAPSHPRAAAALLRIADIYYNAKQFQSALIAYQKIDILYPQSPLVADAQYGTALSYLQLQQDQQFLREAGAFTRKFAHHPLRVSLLLQVAEYYQQQGRPEDAIQTYTQLAEQHPASPLVDKAWFHLGNLYMAAGQPQQALLTYEQLLREGQSETLKPDALLGQGKAHETMGNRDAALQSYAQIAQTYPASGLAAEGLYRAGRLLMSEEKYQEAQGYFETVVVRYPAEPVRYASLFQLGVVLLHLQQPGAAIDRLQQAQQTPDRHLAAQVQIMLGHAYGNTGDRQKSINAYLRVPYLYPDETLLVKQALRQVGRHYVALKQCSEATTVYNKLLTHITDAQESREIEQEMALSGCP